ncbi:MAG: hypothetical protein H7836_11275 [Magnetococcus sp. YQC-3]
MEELDEKFNELVKDKLQENGSKQLARLLYFYGVKQAMNKMMDIADMEEHEAVDALDKLNHQVSQFLQSQLQAH